MTVRILSSSEKLNVMVFYLVACTLVYSTLGCALTYDHLVTPSSAGELALLIGQGLFGYGNQVCITNGLTHGRAVSVMCMQYLSIVTSELIGMLLFEEYTTGWGLVGMFLVVGTMVVYVLWESKRKAQDGQIASADKP
jgi:drug/metabolite transporter (DMT)-like permease